MIFKKLIMVVATLGGLYPCAARADLIVPSYSATYDGIANFNNVTLTLASTVPFPTKPATISVEDIRGTAAIVDTATSSFDILFSGSAPLPNSLLLGLNSTLSQEVLLSFDLVSSNLTFEGSFYTGDVIAAATGIAVGTVTDASLTPFIGTTFFGFIYEPDFSDPQAGLLTYGLSTIVPSTAIAPEPDSILLVGGTVLLSLIVVRSRLVKQS